MIDNIAMIGELTLQHLVLSLVPVALALLVSLVLGYLIHLTGRAASPVLAVSSVVYAIPSIALFVGLPVILGTRILDPINIIVALTIYSVALLNRSVVDGLRAVPAEVNQAATAMGYGRVRRLFGVELPLAMPVVLSGLRVVTVANIAMVTVGAVIGMGALGELFNIGFGSGFLTPIIVGIVAVMVLALLADGGILLLQRALFRWATKERAA
ncbi:ABC transporter permease [Microlunatus sp. Y2014]|uniref:ABC transporter permease n=1 Tax=Microlunatus sp. Y2014 TaxID=3418488 RepID=UPI003DA6F006